MTASPKALALRATTGNRRYCDQRCQHPHLVMRILVWQARKNVNAVAEWRVRTNPVAAETLIVQLGRKKSAQSARVKRQLSAAAQRAQLVVA